MRLMGTAGWPQIPAVAAANLLSHMLLPPQFCYGGRIGGYGFCDDS